jgi:glycosyltransferase involved in cell wall biosynthesis
VSALGSVLLSVVVPVYRGEECLLELHRRLTSSVSLITDDYELVFIDDRSPDGAWPLLRALAREDSHVRAFRLSRNFGQHAAITAGLSLAHGDWAVVMDCDLQEAPEDIPRLWAAAGDHFDIVRAIRRVATVSPVKRFSSHLYRALTTERGELADFSTLSLISRQVIDAFVRLRDQDREYMGVLGWLGFDSTTIEIQHHERYAGRSAYGLRALVTVALDGMFFRSAFLLRLVMLVGFLVALVGAGLAAYEVVDYLGDPARAVPGYASIVVLLLVLSGVIIISVGVVGLYVARIFEQVKDRPLYLIDAGTDDSPVSRTLLSAESADRPL